jgi:uncharacterized protein DUF4149
MRSLASIAVSMWLGVMAFFSFAAAPAAFTTLDREVAGRYVSALFPRYYAVGMALGVLALFGALGAALQGGWRAADRLALGLVLVMLALTACAWLWVLPAAHAAREAMHHAGGVGSPEASRFAQLHRLSSVLNVIVMIAGIVLLVQQAARRP